MISRSFSTLALWVGAAVVLVIFGTAGAVLLLTVLSGLTQWELYNLMERAGTRTHKELGVALGSLLVLGAYVLPEMAGRDAASAGSELLILSVAGTCAASLHRRELADKLRSLVSTLFGILYIPYMLHFAVVLAQRAATDSEGLFLAIWLVVVAKFTDVGGLLIGTRFGKHHLAARSSPRKTWEGAIGGTVFALIAGNCFLLLFHSRFPETFRISTSTLIAIPVAAAAILSDLVESIFKRQAQVKDSGRMIPGIGGAFDLMDSLVLSLPLGYLLIDCAIL